MIEYDETQVNMIVKAFEDHFFIQPTSVASDLGHHINSMLWAIDPLFFLKSLVTSTNLKDSVLKDWTYLSKTDNDSEEGPAGGGLTPDSFLLSDTDRQNTKPPQNVLLYVLIGDPALRLTTDKVVNPWFY